MKGTKEKPLSKFDKVAIVIIAVYLVIAVPLVCCVDAFSLCWFFFGFFAVFCPIAFLWRSSKIIEKKGGVKSRAGIALLAETLVYIIQFWLYDLLYMAIFSGWLIWQFVFGVISIIIIFVNLVKTFANEVKVARFMLALELVIGLGLTIYLIYIIPIDSLRTIVTAIVAAVYGGLLTLSGVAWTIHRSDKLKKEEEIQKAKPIFTFEMQYAGNVDLTGKKVCLSDEEPNDFAFRCFVLFENSNHSVFSIEGIYHDNKWCKMGGNKVVLPHGKVYVDFRFNELDDVYMKIVDGLQNDYYYKMRVLLVDHNPYVQEYLHTVNDLQETCKRMLIVKGIIAEEKNGCVGQK